MLTKVVLTRANPQPLDLRSFQETSLVCLMLNWVASNACGFSSQGQPRASKGARNHEQEPDTVAVGQSISSEAPGS